MTTTSDAPANYDLKVDGEPLRMEYRFVEAEEILQQAVAAGIIADGNSRLLCSLAIEGKEYRVGDEVDLEIDCEFITILTTSTEVA